RWATTSSWSAARITCSGPRAASCASAGPTSRPRPRSRNAPTASGWNGAAGTLRREADRMARKPASIDDYLATLTPEQRAVMAKLRATIGAAAPRAVEVIRYGMPGYKLDGRGLISFAAWKRHYSLYALTSGVKRA